MTLNLRDSKRRGEWGEAKLVKQYQEKDWSHFSAKKSIDLTYIKSIEMPQKTCERNIYITI